MVYKRCCECSRRLFYVHVLEPIANGRNDTKVKGQTPTVHAQDTVFYHIHVSLWTGNFWKINESLVIERKVR